MNDEIMMSLLRNYSLPFAMMDVPKKKKKGLFGDEFGLSDLILHRMMASDMQKMLDDQFYQAQDLRKTVLSRGVIPSPS